MRGSVVGQFPVCQPSGSLDEANTNRGRGRRGSQWVPAYLLSVKIAERSVERLVKTSLWYEAKMLEFCPRPIGNVQKGFSFLEEGHV